jgi:hypothetical protein
LGAKPIHGKTTERRLNRDAGDATFSAMRERSDSRWIQFGVKVGAWSVCAGLAWLYPFVFLDEPIDFLVPNILLVAGAHTGFFEPTKLPGVRGAWVKRGIAVALVVASFWTSLPGRPGADALAPANNFEFSFQ